MEIIYLTIHNSAVLRISYLPWKQCNGGNIKHELLFSLFFCDYCYFSVYFVKYFYSSKRSGNGVLTENEKNCII